MVVKKMRKKNNVAISNLFSLSKRQLYEGKLFLFQANIEKPNIEKNIL